MFLVKEIKPQKCQVVKKKKKKKRKAKWWDFPGGPLVKTLALPLPGGWKVQPPTRFNSWWGNKDPSCSSTAWPKKKKKEMQRNIFQEAQ